MQMDNISNMMSSIKNAEAIRKREVIVWPASKLAGEVLRILQREGYVGEIELIDDGRGGKFRVQLLGRINDCGAVKPRYPVKRDEILEYARRYLPSRELGILIISTNNGLKTHNECLDEGIGGVLIAYVY
jgi:small subunit ribosomal protein S8